MAKARPARIQDLLGMVHALYPPSLAEEWDNVGLQVGDPAATVSRVLISLDPSEAALAAAEAAGAQALLSHHPLFLRPLKNLTPGDEAGRVALGAVRAGVALLAAHTNLDRASSGLNDWLSERLGLEAAVPLSPGGGELLKLAVYVPAGYEDAVSEALFAAGAGQIGRYDRCSFRATGTGTFRPGPGTTPFLGAEGKNETSREVRLETLLPREHLGRAVERMKKAHPYEEVAYDLYPLANRREDVGLGRLGRLAAPETLHRFASRVREALGASAVRVVGDPERSVSKVALCGGSGAGLLSEAARAGADVLVTGDVKYHEARQAEARGVALVDAGHFPTEHLAVEGLVQALRAEAERRGLKIEFLEMEGETDPFRTV